MAGGELFYHFRRRREGRGETEIESSLRKCVEQSTFTAL